MSAQHTPGPLLRIDSDENGYFVRFGTAREAHAAKRQHDTAPELLKELRLLNLDENGQQRWNTPAGRLIAKITGSPE